MPRRSVVLASASPRRAALLRGIGLRFEVVASSIDESRAPGEAPAAMAERLARAKAVALDSRSVPTLAIAADTIVVTGGRMLGKPRDRDDARRMLGQLAGRTHEVITAVAIRALPEENIACERALTKVTFAPMSREEIAWYAATGEGDDKAGSYALQGIGAIFVAGLEGSYTNVIGLPLERLYPHLRRWNCLP